MELVCAAHANVQTGVSMGSCRHTHTHVHAHACTQARILLFTLAGTGSLPPCCPTPALGPLSAQHHIFPPHAELSGLPLLYHTQPSGPQWGTEAMSAQPKNPSPHGLASAPLWSSQNPPADLLRRCLETQSPRPHPRDSDVKVRCVPQDLCAEPLVLTA